MVVVPAGEAAVVVVVVVVCVAAAAGVAAAAEVCVNRTAEFSFALAVPVVGWTAAGGFAAAAGAGELVWACEKDNAAIKDAVAPPNILKEVAIITMDERMPGCLKQEADQPALRLKRGV
jgi:hypothetical protein